MSDKHELENNRFILEGRIYPAIRACVNNRYRIILAFFAYYSFIYTGLVKTPNQFCGKYLFYVICLSELSKLLA